MANFTSDYKVKMARMKQNRAMAKKKEALLEGGDRAVNFVIHTILILAGLCCLYPLWYVLIASFSTPLNIGLGQVWLWPVGFTLAGYEELFDTNMIWIGYRNTIIYTALCAALGMVLQVGCGYALSRRAMPGRRWINLFFVFTMYFSGGTIPTYMLLSSFGWVNNPIVMIVPGAFSVWNMIIARSHFMGSIPESLFDAARIDGCSYIRFFFKVALPLSGATLAILALYNIQGHWNSYMTGLMYLRDSKLFTLQQVIQNIQKSAMPVQELPDPNMDQLLHEYEFRAQLLKYTAVIAGALPLIIAYPFLQKFFIKGVMVGSVKG